MRLDIHTQDASPIESTVDYYHLTEWPSDAFLIGSPIRALLTGLLEREPLTLGRLATLSGETVNSCREFLQDLDKEGVLETLQDEASLSDFPPLFEAAKTGRH